jgi:hypothetical protein
MGTVNLRVNQNVNLGYTFNHHPLRHSSKPIRPYQTLLLLQDPKRIFDSGMPAGTCDQHHCTTARTV